MEPYQQLEQQWAEFNDIDPDGMVVCSSGTAALHLALEAMRIPLGSEVIIPDFTMIACARACTLAGMTPVFVDCDDRLLMQSLNAMCHKDIKAIMAVHIYGRRCDMNTLAKVADDNNLYLVEDLAEAHGVPVHERTNAACWSYFRNKIVAGEEGGAVWFRNPEHAEYARQLRSLGFTERHDFMHVPRGHNYRMSNAHAALILDSLGKYKSNVAARREIEGWCNSACQPEWRMPPRQAPWVYDLRIPRMTIGDQNRIVKALHAAGIAARHAFKPMSIQEEYKQCRVIGTGKALTASREVIYLPLVGMTKDDCKRAFDVIINALS